MKQKDFSVTFRNDKQIATIRVKTTWSCEEFEMQQLITWFGLNIGLRNPSQKTVVIPSNYVFIKSRSMFGNTIIKYTKQQNHITLSCKPC